METTNTRKKALMKYKKEQLCEMIENLLKDVEEDYTRIFRLRIAAGILSIVCIIFALLLVFS